MDVKKVVLGISGGVDSSAAAIILKNQGYEVIGVTFIFTEDYNVNDAIEVCKKLNIKHYIKDYRKEFKEKIINKFISDYKLGITPNPCVLCNKIVKMKYLFDAMEEYGADFVATGHYARVLNGKLYKSENLNKDQSYFLSQLTKKQLERVIFPIDNLKKEDVRKLAEENGLVNASKKDSFDVCFINTSFRDYINNHIEETEGIIINKDTNEKIGKHNGLSFYTIGQRKGLDLGGNKDRLFVVEKDIENNILYVGSDNENKYLYSTSAIIENVNWITDKKITKCNAKFRYRSIDNPVTLEYLENENVLVKYLEGVKSVTPGQACVFYENDECLGGGIIKEIVKDN